MSDEWKFFLLAIMVSAATIWCAESLTDYRCNKYQEITGNETRRAFMTACYVKSSNGEWMRRSEHERRLRYIAIKSK